MKRIISFFLIMQIAFLAFAQNPIIADHTVVDKYDKIPQQWIDSVKTMLVDIAGESHSSGYRLGVNLLEAYDSKFQVAVYSGTPSAYSNKYLRFGIHASVGEEHFFTTQTAINGFKVHITAQNSTGNPYNVMGFGWCYDATYTEFGVPLGTKDPIYNVRWYGVTVGSPDGAITWGLDKGDSILTSNRVNMDTYLNAVEQYNQLCIDNGYNTKVIFTTGPVDNGAGNLEGTENGFQREIKHDYIRNYVATNSRILFDYADILCWNNSGVEYITNWNDGGTLRPHANIHPDNMMDYDASWKIVTHTEDGDHIGEVGALRLAKAMWWMLARIAGWDGGITTIPVTGITVTGTSGATTITTDNGTLQLTATIAPSNATNKNVTWSIQNGTGQASINTAGLVTAIANGTVTAIATAADGSGVTGSLIITLSNQVIPVTGISVTGAGGATTITTDNGTLQLTATVSPDNATNKNVTWSIQNGTGQASINTTGLVTAIANGTVTAVATAADGSGITGSRILTLSNQVIPVTGITVNGAGGATTITTDNGTLQLTATVLPDNATNKNVIWSIQNGTGQASINTTGLVTAIANGTVTAIATAADGSGVTCSRILTLSNQVIPVTGITVTGAGGATTITIDNGTLQLTATVSPDNATNKNVTWSVQNGTGQASISPAGQVTAIANGTVTAIATAADGSGVTGSLILTLSNQVIPVTGITVTGAGGATTITTDNGTLQLTATVLPDNATNKNVTWSIQNGTGQASINTTGLVTAIANGTVTSVATAADGSGITGSRTLTLSNQVILVTGITVTGAGGATTIILNGGTLQLSAAVLPADATNNTVTWSISNSTGQATINSSGLVTAITYGTVIARATANDGSGISGTMTITISNQTVFVNSITITGTGGISTITTNCGTLQLSTAVLPADATNKTVTWSISNGSGQATINSSGLVTAIVNGTVTARATANDGSGVSGTLILTITNQTILVTQVTVSGVDGISVIPAIGGTLQLLAAIEPFNATNKTVTWNITNGTGQATISSTGLVTGVANGTVTARATANDDSGVSGILSITISNQMIPVSGITVTGTGGATTISANRGTLQLINSVLPADATNKNVTWSIDNITGQATINSSGLVTAITNGTVIARATANDGSGVTGSLVITISNQKVKVKNIKIYDTGGSIINTSYGTLQLSVEVSPDDASDKTVTWSVVNDTGKAAISSTGLVTAISNGIVMAIATANDDSGVSDTLTITIYNQIVFVSGIKVTSAGGITIITTDDGSLQLNAEVLPSYATNKTVTWSIQNGTGLASVSNAGLVTAIAEGTITVKATANDGSLVTDSLELTISGKIKLIDSIIVTTLDDAIPIIRERNGKMQMVADIFPEDASNCVIEWSVENHSGIAIINNSGMLTGVSDGSVKVIAKATDGSNVSGSCTVVVINQSTSIKPDSPEDQEIYAFISSDKLIIKRDYPNFSFDYFSLYSIQGVLIHREKITDETIEIDLSLYPPGIYIVSLYNNQKVIPLKVLIPK
jgi:uncharacterized protein YjdB